MSTSAATSCPLIIDGERVPAGAGETFEVRSPATREVLADVARARADDVRRAVAVGQRAFPAWADEKPRERGRRLRRIAAAILDRHEELARLMASETGNAIRTQARPEIAAGAEMFDYFGSLASESKGLTVPLGPTMLNFTVRRPYGVVGAITPWNAPVSTAALKLAMALATGNCVVLKPAEDAPLAITEIAAIAQEHLPPGVLNVVPGFGDEAGAALLADPGIGKLSFTGSTATGRKVLHAAAERILPVTLELGGKSPVIVFPDSDTDAAAAGVITGMRFSRQGQSCTAGSRLLVHADVFDSFLDRVVGALGRLKVGDPLDEASDVGAIINDRQYERVRGYVADAVEAGARLCTGAVPEPAPQGGLFVDPVILADVGADWPVAAEEVFGPVLVARPWTDEQAVIDEANATPYGLAGFVWCREVGAALRVAQRIEAGWIQVNQGVAQQLGQAFGGMKQSGLGREHSLEAALDAYTEVQAIDVNLA
jgi:acyl-CoA reductase-like NAD-dependent aldehyde dehydrogenase